MEAGLEKPEGGGSEAVAVTDMPGRLPGVSVSELISSGERVAVLTADDGLLPKPEPDLFLEAACRIGIEPCYCQVFEDADAGLEAARRAGMLATDVRPVVGGY